MGRKDKEAAREKREELRQLCDGIRSTLDTRVKLAPVWLKVVTGIQDDHTALTPQQVSLLEKIDALETEQEKRRVIRFMTRILIGGPSIKKKKSAEKKKSAKKK